MNNYFRNLWYEIDKLASHDPMIFYTFAAAVVLFVGVMCLRGNVIKR